MLADVIPAMVTVLGALACFRSRGLDEPKENVFGRRVVGAFMLIGGVYYFASKYSGLSG